MNRKLFCDKFLSFFLKYYFIWYLLQKNFVAQISNCKLVTGPKILWLWISSNFKFNLVYLVWLEISRSILEYDFKIKLEVWTCDYAYLPRPHFKSGPFANQPLFDNFKFGHVHISDPYCTRAFVSPDAVVFVFKLLVVIEPTLETF